MVAELDYTCELRNIRCIEEDKSVKKVISFLMAVMMLVLAVSSVMAEETAAAPVSVTVIRMTAVKYYGETAVLKASVQNAEPSAQIRWQICPDYVSGRIDNWQEARTGETIRVELTYSSVNSGYRCILPTGEVSPVYTFSGITDAPVEEIIVEETVEEEIITEEIIAEDIIEEEIITEEITAEDIIEEEIITEEITAEDTVEEEIITEEITAEDTVEEEIITEEITAEDTVEEDDEFEEFEDEE